MVAVASGELAGARGIDDDYDAEMQHSLATT